MPLNRHFQLRDRHAFLAPSSPAWSNYDDDKLIRVFANHLEAQRGTELHDFAKNAIKLGQKLQANGKTLNMYVNHAIGYKMTPEQPLYFSENCFGHADALCFRKNKLRIHDLKTGLVPANGRQLEIYAAIFCYEYDMDPHKIEIELRIYQNDDIKIWEADPDIISKLIDVMKTFDPIIDEMKMEAWS